MTDLQAVYHVWELTRPARNRAIACWLTAVVERLERHALREPAMRGDLGGERVVYARLEDVIGLGDENSPHLRGKVDPKRLRWLLVSEDLVFPDTVSVQIGSGRKRKYLAFRMDRIRAFCQEHGA